MAWEDKRKHRIKADYGANHYYRFFKKNYGDIVDRKTYGLILKEFNSHVRDKISKKGSFYTLPCRLGVLEVRKFKREIKINEDNTIENKLPTNWKETKKLWRENPEAKKKRIKIRFTNEHTNGYSFRIQYLRSRANYKNKSIYKMRMNRIMKRTFSESIFKGRIIDAFLKN